MRSVHRAVIDIGTNSIKLLVAEVAGQQVHPVHEESRQTRLGQGFYGAQALQAGPIAKTAEAVAAFAQSARAKGAESIRVIATSAVRDARNANELTARIQGSCDLPVEVISGEREADWAFRGAQTEPTLTGQPILIADVGGGSAQFVLGTGQHKAFATSCRLGTVRLLETLPHSDPPRQEELAHYRNWVKEFLERELGPNLGPALNSARALQGNPAQVLLVGTGGSASILGCMETRLNHFDRRLLDQTEITTDRLSWHTEHLWNLSLAQRREVIGLPANRADVILSGAVIFECVTRRFGFDRLRISTRGLRFAALLDPE